MSDGQLEPSSIPDPPGRRDAPTSDLLDEATRPHFDGRPDIPETPEGSLSRQTLVQVHDHLRQELAEIQRAAAAVADGRLDPVAARSLINRMAMRQNYWTFGAFCAQYCRVVTVHHTIEDRHLFPALHREEQALSAVLERLGEEHEVIAEVLERFDGALVDLMTGRSMGEVRRVADELGDALLSHLAYEENELLGPLGRSSIFV
jgi:hemerythrin-like domain-containing protein